MSRNRRPIRPRSAQLSQPGKMCDWTTNSTFRPSNSVAHLGLGVDAHVRRKVVAHEVGHPVGQDRQIARSVVLPGEEEAVCFERIQAIRRVDDDVSAGRKHAIGLLNRRAVVVDVLDDLVQQDDVEARVRGRATLRPARLADWAAIAGATDLVGVDVDAVDVVAELSERETYIPRPQPMSRMRLARNSTYC